MLNVEPNGSRKNSRASVGFLTLNVFDNVLRLGNAKSVHKPVLFRHVRRDVGVDAIIRVEDSTRRVLTPWSVWGEE